MPELPEVETIRQVLEPQIKGQKITDITIENPQVIGYPDADSFCEGLTGQVIAAMSRRGKFLLLHLESGDRVILHLRMTGCLLVTPAAYPLEKHTHVILQLGAKTQLRFSDTRRFGRLWLLQKEEPDRYSGISKLGPEPFDAACNASYLQKMLGKRKKAIKECLLEQNIVAGIGNIYSDEILFHAKISPLTPANRLTTDDWECLAEAIPERLAYFIEKNSITAEAYLAGKGKNYQNTPFLQVYGHAGAPCPHCGKTLMRTVIGGRSSVYCPGCQGEPPR